MRYQENKINKAVNNNCRINEEAMELVNQHYSYLYNKLVLTDNDQDVFNDTVLAISYRFDSSKDFVKQFTELFQSLQMEHVREGRKRRAIFQSIDDESSTIQLEDIPDEEQQQDDTMNKLIEAINANVK